MKSFFFFVMFVTTFKVGAITYSAEDSAKIDRCFWGFMSIREKSDTSSPDPYAPLAGGRELCQVAFLNEDHNIGFDWVIVSLDTPNLMDSTRKDDCMAGATLAQKKYTPDQRAAAIRESSERICQGLSLNLH